jgi:hypothetical protein
VSRRCFVLPLANVGDAVDGDGVRHARLHLGSRLGAGSDLDVPAVGGLSVDDGGAAVTTPEGGTAAVASADRHGGTAAGATADTRTAAARRTPAVPPAALAERLGVRRRADEHGDRSRRYHQKPGHFVTFASCARICYFPLPDPLQARDYHSNSRFSDKKKFRNWQKCRYIRVMNTPKFTEWRLIRESVDHLKMLADTIPLTEADSSHYSIEVNFRTTKEELLDAYAKLVLGYVSAAVKQSGYHVKHVYSEKPIRILVATRNWDDGEWVSSVIYHPEHNCFVMTAGHWNKDRRTVSVNDDETKKLDAENAAGIATKLVNYMHDLKKKEPRTKMLKPAPHKRGPKK